MMVVHVGRLEYGVCDAHRIYWLFGENLMSGWRYEVERIMERDSVGWEAGYETLATEGRAHLADYREAKPLEMGELVPHTDPESCVLDPDGRRDGWQPDPDAWKKSD